MGLFSSKKTRTVTTNTTDVQDRRIGAEGGSAIAAEGANQDFSDRSRTSETFNLVDSDTAQASVEVLRDVSSQALSENTSALDRVLDFATDASSRATETAAGALAGAQETTAAALQKTASEQNQALETITRGAMIIAAAYFVAQIFRS